jgi:transposase
MPSISLPHGFPKPNTVYGHFAHWQLDGTFEHLPGVLRHLVPDQWSHSGAGALVDTSVHADGLAPCPVPKACTLDAGWRGAGTATLPRSDLFYAEPGCERDVSVNFWEIDR